MLLSRLLLAGAAGLFLAQASAADEAPAPAPADANAELRRQASYLIGTDIAQKIGGIIEQNDLDHEQVAKGVSDALAGKPSAISPELAGDIMKRFQDLARQAHAEKAAKEAAEAPLRKERNAAWLAENGKRDGIVTTASGLQYEVLTAGAGTGAAAKMGDQVSVNYKGSLIDGTVFDASERHGGPASFTVGQVIAGWNEALALMKEGDKWKLYIPSELAYGEQGPPGIGANQVLIFEVELLKVSPKS
jgi:FKBP-type peptidyl-prolyl cis-trans isomerase